MIKIKNVNNTIKDLKNKIEIEIQTKKKSEMKAIVEKLKDATPVDTGLARDSWKIDGDRIVNDVEYIDYLNQGSSKQAPSHFVENTILSHKGVSPNGVIVIQR